VGRRRRGRRVGRGFDWRVRGRGRWRLWRGGALNEIGGGNGGAGDGILMMGR